MKKAGKMLGIVVVVGFVLYLIIGGPIQAADTVSGFVGTIGDGFSSVMEFFRRLLS